MAVRMNASEAGGFKLLEEDALDDRPPCAAVKKFVSSVLDRKDMKDADVANSFRNLMEYRDSTSSPSQCSVSTSTSALDSDRLDRLNSPPSPSSPPGPMVDDQRLPNELLDEICEDIGMKEGMELDFVEYLMEQDTNNPPHMYMTPEAICSSSGAFNSAAGSTISTPTGSASGGSNSGSSGSNNNNSSSHNNNNNESANKTLTLLSTPSSSSSTSTTTPNFLFKPNFNDSDWLSQLPSPLIPTSSGQSSGTTTIQSSENSSPANKRIHLSASTDTSPNKGRSQTPPGFNQHNQQQYQQHQQHAGYSTMGMAFGPPPSSAYPGGFSYSNNNQNMFKMPQAGPLSSAGPPKRSHSYPQGAPASSPVHSTTSSQGSHSSSSSLSHSYSSTTAASHYHPHHHQQQQHQQQQHQQSLMRGPHEFSMNPPSDASDQEDAGSNNVINNNNNNNKSKNNNTTKVPCVSPKPVVPTSSSSSTSLPFVKPGSPTAGTTSNCVQNNFGARDGSVFQRVGKPAPPPNVNVKSMQEQQQQQQQQPQHHHHQQQQHNQHRWMGPQQKQGGPMPNAPGGFFAGKGMYPGPAYPMGMTHPPHPSQHHMGHHMGPPGPHSAPVRTPADSPLDQGYFSNESAGNCSSGSAPSPAFTTSSMSSFSSISTMMPADQSAASVPMQQQQQQQQQQKSSMMQPQQHHPGMPNGRPQSQKSVHFADMPSDGSPPAYPQNPTAVSSASASAGSDVKPFGQHQPPPGSTSPPDCAFEADASGNINNSNGQPKSGKILPRFNHGSKSGVAPYTVPNQGPASTGMVMGPPQQPGGSPSHGHPPPPPPPEYDFSNRSSCALSGNNGSAAGGMNNNGSGRDSTSPGEAMQAEFGSRPSSQNNTVAENSSFFMDGNSTIIKPEGGLGEFPPPPPAPPLPGQATPGEYGTSMQQHGRYSTGMEQYSAMQQHHQHQQQQHQMQQHQQQQQHFHESVHSHPSHPMQQHHHQQHQPFPSCSHNSGPQQQQQQEYGGMHPQPHHHHQQHQQQQHPHNSSMQIASQPSPGGFQMPLAMSTPLSGVRPGPSPRMGGPAGPNSSYGPNVYPQQSYEGYNPYHSDMYSQQGRWRSEEQQQQQQLQVQVGGMQHPQHHMAVVPPSPMKGGVMQGPHPHPPGLPHMQPSPTPGAAAPMGPGPPNPHVASMPQHHHHPHQMPDMSGGMMGAPSSSSSSSCAGPPPPHPNMAPGPHPEYGPCMGMNCTACKMAQAGTPPGQHPHMGPCVDPGKCHPCKGMPMVGSGIPPHHLNHHGSHPSQQHPPSVHPGAPLPPPPPGQHMGPCQGPNCAACKVSQAHRPQMLSSQQKFIQHLIMDEGNSAYRSHPLFPLLRDLVIAEMNFDNPRFHYQQLLSLLPNDFQKLLQNFLHRNPPSGHYQSNQAVESVIMDGLRLAHSNLVDKIRLRREMEKMKANSSASLRSMEEFCQKFDHSVNGPMGRPMPNAVGSMGMGHPMAGYDGSYIQPGMAHLGQYRPMKDGQDMLGETALAAATAAQQGKTESKKHPSLPKEAVAMMMEWLRNHKDNPYPNDDEKAMLIKQTGLSINQINYWFTNARRRILPKWAQCKT